MRTIKKLLIAVAPGFIFSVCAAQDLTVCASSSYSIPSIKSAGGAATYVWLENGVEIAGATGESYTNTKGNVAGTYLYTRMVKTPNCDWQSSNSVIVWVVGMKTPPPLTAPQNACEGEKIELSVPATPGTTFSWNVNNIFQNEGNTCTIASATAGKILVMVSVSAVAAGLHCTQSSAVAVIDVHAMPKIKTHPVSKDACLDGTEQLSVSADNATAYQWFKNGVAVTEGTGHNTAKYTTVALKSDATYKVVVSNAGACSATSNEAKLTVKSCCNSPGSTATFTTFKPCEPVTKNSVWTLVDDREANNVQSYKVKLMADSRYWMIQDLKFGKGCEKTTFLGSNNSTKDQKDIVAPGYYGNCRKSFNASDPAAGHLYDWAAAINKAQAYYNSSKNVGCAGTGASANACQGICPAGWHVPTRSELENAKKVFQESYNCTAGRCWKPGSAWDGTINGRANGSNGTSETDRGHYWSSTYNSAGTADMLYFNDSGTADFWGLSKDYGVTVRCVRNY